MTVDKKNTPRELSGRTYSNILIEPFRQVKFGLYMIAICLAFILAAGWLFWDSWSDQYAHVMQLFNVVEPELRREFILDDLFYTNAVRLGIFFLIFLTVMFVTVFKLTHRYYGPLVSIEKFIGELEEGNYSARVAIRSKDELQGLVSKLNKLAENLEKKS